ncbi:MAG: type II toxin-antitoxin system RelE/ParE family toxin [Opitutaceae bacterium]
MKSHALHPEADEEYAEAAQHYANISPELGGRFYDAIECLIAEACERPKAFRQIRPPVRRHFTTEFPYGILYVERPDDIWIVAVMPLKRAPDYWLHRLD